MLTIIQNRYYPKSHLKRLLGSTFLSIFSLVLILMLAEVLLWQLSLKTQIIKSDRWIFAMSRIGHGCFQLDKKTIYRPISNKGTDGCWQTDTHGFRITPTLNQNIELNILFMGDSFTFGHDVGDKETYPYYIQKSLDEEKLPVRVFNGGIAGYGMDQQIVFLENYVLADFRPDIVIWNINENDVYDNDQACLFTVKNGKLKQHPGYMNTIYLLGSFYQRVPTFIRQLKSFLLLSQLVPNRWTLGCSRNTKNDAAYQPLKTKLLLERILNLSRLYGFKLVFTYMQSQFAYVTNPSSWYIKNTQRQLAAIGSAGVKPIVVSNEILESATTQLLAANTSRTNTTEDLLGVSTNDLSVTLFLAIDPQMFGSKHMNAEGNEEVALVVYQHLRPLLEDKLSFSHW